MSPVCGVVDGSAAICSDSASAGDSLLKSVADVLLAAVNSVDPLVSDDCSDGAGVLANGDSRPRGDSN